MRKEKVKIKMLGNFDKYEAGQITELSEDEAGKLLSLGYATKIEEVKPEVKDGV